MLRVYLCLLAPLEPPKAASMAIPAWPRSSRSKDSTLAKDALATPLNKKMESSLKKSPRKKTKWPPNGLLSFKNNFFFF